MRTIYELFSNPNPTRRIPHPHRRGREKRLVRFHTTGLKEAHGQETEASVTELTGRETSIQVKR